MRILGRAFRRLGLSVWDFLVGDTPEILFVTAAVVGLAYASRSVHVLSVIVLPLFVAAALIGSVCWAARSGSQRQAGEGVARSEDDRAF